MVVSWPGESVGRWVGWKELNEVLEEWCLARGAVCGMCSRVSKAAWSQEQAVISLGKNLALYLPMGACPKMALVAPSMYGDVKLSVILQWLPLAKFLKVDGLRAFPPIASLGQVSTALKSSQDLDGKAWHSDAKLFDWSRSITVRLTNRN